MRHAEQVAAEQSQLRATFNAVAELYDRVRPTYPSRLITDLVFLCGLGPHSRVLEIGPGTGQLTKALAAHGCSIEAVELGPDLAVIARANLASFPRAHVSIAAFEQWPLPPDPFDVVVAATSFHWIDPQVRVAKSAAALRPGARWPPSPPVTSPVEPLSFSPRFRPVTGAGTPPPQPTSSYRHHTTSSTTAKPTAPMNSNPQSSTIRTYAATQALPPSVREGLIDCITTLITEHYGGTVLKRYLFELRVARRRS